MFNINVPGVILAGGQSRRMNRKDKAFLEIGERTLLDMIIERLGPQSYKMAINTNSYSYKYKRYGLPILHDHMEGYLGPLAGILTAMEWAKDTGYEKVITVAVDTPLFPLNLVLLPYEHLPLHIFEPRYKLMIKNAIEHNKPFGIILSEGKGVFSKGVKVCVKEVFKKYSNGEYDILVEGEEIFKVKGTQMDGDTVMGDVEFLPIQTGMEGPQFQKFQESYLKILLKFGVDRDLELHMKKKISFEFLQGLQLPLILKKEIINIKDEVNRLEFIKNIFNNILEADSKSPSGNLPQA